MAEYKGRLFLLALGDGADPENFSTIGCLRSTEFSYSTEMVDVTCKDNAPHRTLLEDAGIKSASISGSGIMNDAASIETLNTRALAGTIHNYKITSEYGDTFVGAFLITSFSRNGEYNESEQYSITLESSGEVTRTAPA